jgi:hypothetical protein
MVTKSHCERADCKSFKAVDLTLMKKCLNNSNSCAFKVNKAPTLDRDGPGTVSLLRLLLQVLKAPPRFGSI